ncbi:scavenger receptor cysteine-rich domain-containing protein DMBT1-like [Glandiceps talaboti]
MNDTSFTSPNYPASYEDNIACTWTITFDEGSTINSVFTDFNIDGDGDSLLIYDGRVEEEQLIGCQYIYLDAYGTFTSSNSEFSGSDTCSWMVNPTGKDGALVLTLSQLSMKSGDQITVYYGKTVESPKIATIDSSLRTTPIIFSTDNTAGPLLVEYTKAKSVTNDDVDEDGLLFLAVYELHGSCQKEISAKPNGQLHSPYFPNYYPVNAMCWHKLKIGGEKLVHLYFDTFKIYDKHQVQIVNNTENSIVIGSYSGDVPPNDIIFEGTDVEIRFSSVNEHTDLTVMQGYNVSYTLLDCGDNFTKGSDKFSTPGYPKALNTSTTCLWIISIPSKDSKSGNVSIIDFKIDFIVSKQTASNYIEIRDGPSQRSELIPMSELENKTVLSRYNYLWVKYVYSADENTGGLKANFSYETYGKYYNMVHNY